MAYQILRKLYYGDEQIYLKTYTSRFESEEAVKLDFLIGNKPAFFLQNTEVVSLAFNIAKLDKKVLKLSEKLPGVAKAQYSRKCLIDEIVLTNKIEGVHSSRKDIGDALDILENQSQAKGKHQRFLSLVNKYYMLMENEEIPLKTCQDIRNIYNDALLEEVITEDPKNAPDGKIFRKELTSVHSQTDKVIHQGVMPESKIIELMDKALAFLNDESIEQLYRICIFHYLIEYIHPFYDGNGRLGRFILSYCLSETLEPLVAFRISETIKENINIYYKAFEECNDSHNLGDLTSFLIMLLNMIYSALTELYDSLNRKSISWEKYEHLVSTFPVSSNKNIRIMYSLLIQAALFSENGISTKELMTELDLSYYNVKKLLDSIPSDQLKSGTKGKEKVYQIDINVLDEIVLIKDLYDDPPQNSNIIMNP